MRPEPGSDVLTIYFFRQLVLVLQEFLRMPAFAGMTSFRRKPESGVSAKQIEDFFFSRMQKNNQTEISCRRYAVGFWAVKK